MINLFEEQTAPLNEYEKDILMPVIIKGLKLKIGRKNAVTNSYIVKRLKPDYCIDSIRLRKIINHIRTHDLIPALIATSKGYYIAQEEEELKDYEKSLLGREEAIRNLRLSIERQRQRLYTETI